MTMETLGGWRQKSPWKARKQKLTGCQPRHTRTAFPSTHNITWPPTRAQARSQVVLWRYKIHFRREHFCSYYVRNKFFWAKKTGGHCHRIPPRGYGPARELSTSCWMAWFSGQATDRNLSSTWPLKGPAAQALTIRNCAEVWRQKKLAQPLKKHRKHAYSETHWRGDNMLNNKMRTPRWSLWSQQC